MKKKAVQFFFCFIIILAFAGAVFYFGWTQFKLKPNQLGFVSSKIMGLNKNPVEYGKFSWNWDFLIPTNATLTIFDLKQYNIEKNVQGSLPNSEIFKESFNEKLNFDYNISFDFKILISKQNLVNLFEKNLISNQQELENYIDSACEESAKNLENNILLQKENNNSFKPELLSQEELFQLANVKSSFPDLDFSSISVKNSTLPDIELYKKIRTEYISGITYYEPTITYTDKIVPGRKGNVFQDLLKQSAEEKLKTQE